MPDSRYKSRSPSPYSKRAERSSRGEEHPRSRSPRRGYSSPFSPLPGHQERSRSPRRRDHERPRKSGGGFRWKEKPRNDNDDERDNRRLDRGYREHEQPKPRSPVRDSGRRDDVEAKFGPTRSDKPKAAEDKPEEQPEKEKKKKKKVAPGIQPTGEPMIIVNVNDRLGTKASIPCLASDPIKLFKAQVAARIGRQPHEIMLKRQGERPFKDQLTLEDYGVSNGVQLDLEIDTGD